MNDTSENNIQKKNRFIGLSFTLYVKVYMIDHSVRICICIEVRWTGKVIEML